MVKNSKTYSAGAFLEVKVVIQEESQLGHRVGRAGTSLNANEASCKILDARVRDEKLIRTENVLRRIASVILGAAFARR